MKETCSIYDDDPGEDTSFNENDPLNYRKLIVDDRDKLLYCLVGKTGSTTFTRIMRRKFDQDNNTYVGYVDKGRNMGFIRDTPLYTLDYITNVTERQYKLNNYRSFLIARNPYLRLYSAYLHKNDKLLKYATSNTTNSQQIEETPLTKQADEASRALTFNTFLQLLVQSMKANFTAFNHSPLNGHFVDVWTHCHPCHIRYDYIFKTETLETDKQLFLPMLHEKYLIHKNKFKGRLHPLKGTKLTQADILDPISAIQQIPTEILEDITDLYRHDNEVFGYGLDSDQRPISLV